MTKRYFFTVRANESTEAGKPTWPDSLSITVTRMDALKILAEISSMLVRQGNDELVDIFLVGRMGEDYE